MRKFRIIKCNLLLCLLALIVLCGCTGKASTGEPPTGEALHTYDNKNLVSSKLDTCENLVANMNLSGYTGEILATNETVWLQNVLKANPKLFEAFLNPDNNNLAKAMWHGEFPGKILTGMAQNYLTTNNAETLKIGNEMVKYFKQAQGEDGYLGPWSSKTRFNKDKAKWDTWGQYHCIYGLYRWYQVTGNKDALDVAVKALDCIYDYFITGKQTFVSQNWAECNFAISHVFALLYNETGNQDYLKAAEYIVQDEWKLKYDDFYTKKNISCDWLSAVTSGKAFYKSNQPRWESLYSLETLATLYKVTENKEYYNAMEELWWSIVGNDRHNTGSFGTGEGATGNPYGSGSETCSTVAWMAFSTDYLKLSKNSYVADELELSFYNATLGSLLGNKREFTYMNNSDGSRASALIVLKGHSFEGGSDMSCCQANGNRGLSQIAEWALLTDNEGVYINYYGQSDIKTNTNSGNKIGIKQETEYPKTGMVKMTISTEKNEKFNLSIRIPTWSKKTVVKLNGQECSNVTPGSYYVLNKEWQTGDYIEIEFDMGIHFWVAEDKTIGSKVSAYYGPVLLAFETSGTVRATSRFQIDSLKQIQKTENSDKGLLSFTANTTAGKNVNLIDYASAGKNGETYVSWLGCNRDLDPITYLKNGTPIWNNG